MYEYTDSSIKKLNKKYILRFSKVRSKLNIDQINPLNEISNLYSELEQDARSEYLKIAKHYYAEECRECGAVVDGYIDYLWVNKMLEWYDPVTKYSFLNEAYRKKDRYAEAILSGGDPREETKKALRYWTAQSTQYAVGITDESRLEAMKNAGIKKVRWMTVEDERRCGVCSERDGKTYNIMRVPSKPHFNCRCWIVPIKEK